MVLPESSTLNSAAAAAGAGVQAWRDRFFSADDGLALYFRDYGDPLAPATPLLCLSGVTRSSKDFHDLALRHASTRRVVCPDYRGRGRSAYDPDWRNYRPRTHLADLLALLTVAGLDRVVALGTSAGGILAMALAVARPGALAGVVLNDIGPEAETEGGARILRDSGRDVRPVDWADAARVLRDIWGAAYPRWGEAQWIDAARMTFVETGDDGLRLDYDLNAVRALRAAGGIPAETRQWFSALANIPTLAIRGGLSDILSERTFDEMAAMKPDIIRVTVPDVGHAPDLGEAQSRDAIDAFLAEV